MSTDDRNELYEWYLAFLRKDAQYKAEKQHFTPMGLINADSELLKDIIESETKPQQQNSSQDKNPRQIPSIFGFTQKNDSSKKAEQGQKDDLHRQLELMKQKEKLIFDYCPNLLCKLNAEGKLIDSNLETPAKLAYSREELLGVSLSDLLSSESKSVFSESLARCARYSLPEQIEIRIRCKNGEYKDLLWRMEWSQSVNAFFCLAEDISDRKDNERLRDEMKAMINHDLRAPISALSFWIDNMLLGTYGELDGAMNDSLSRSSRNVKTILSLLDDLVDIEKLESEKMKAVKANVRIQECFDHLSRVFVDWLKETQLSVHFEATDCVVLADFEQLNRILQNFFSNAIKWSPAGTEIRLRAHKQNSFVIIEVEDSGPGIKAEQKEQLFERWGTLNASPRQNSPSSGLGLYISKKLAELQGGAVAVRDSDKGGSIFSVSLPAGSN